jgi:hypothetical protein
LNVGHGIRHLIGQIGMKDAAMAQAVIERADPVKVVAAVRQRDVILACEAAGMVSSCMRHRPDDRRARYLTAIGRDVRFSLQA